MTLEIPDRIARHLTLNEKELIIEFAVFLYQQEILSLRAAAEFAQIPWLKMEEILAEKGIPLKYSEEDLENDLDNLRQLDP